MNIFYKWIDLQIKKINKLFLRLFAGYDSDVYKRIINFRRVLSSKKFYYLLKEYRRFESECYKGNYDLALLGKVIDKLREKYSDDFVIYNGTYYYQEINLLVPDDGPFKDKDADNICRERFKLWEYECEDALKEYYNNRKKYYNKK